LRERERERERDVEKKIYKKDVMFLSIKKEGEKRGRRGGKNCTAIINDH
jgi:hypothetical protein